MQIYKKYNQIFVSYSWIDRYEVREIVRLLDNSGFNPWIDIVNIDLNKNLHEQIYRGIVSSQYFLLIKSKNTMKSNWVNWELNIANKFIHNNNGYVFDLDKNVFGSLHENLNCEREVKDILPKLNKLIWQN